MNSGASGVTFRSCGLLVLVAVAAAVCAGVPLYFVGYFFGQLANDVARGNRQVEIVTGIIAADPEQFGSLSVNRGPAGQFLLEGTVESQADLEQLRGEMVRAFGEERTRQVLAVTVEGNADGG